MILLDENDNAPLWLWFKNLRCVYWQSLRSNSVLPNCVATQKQNLTFLSSLKSEILLDKFSYLSKRSTTPFTDCSPAISNFFSTDKNHSIIYCDEPVLSSIPLSSPPCSHQNTFLLSNPRAGASFCTINTQINPISSFRPAKK
jgi:hypothetical protein